MRRFLTSVIIICLLLGNSSSIAIGIIADEQRVVDLINQERIARGLDPLMISQALMDSSAEFCADVVQHSPLTNDNLGLYYNETHIDYDTGLGFDQRIRKHDPNAFYAGENMDIHYDVDKAHIAFMNSSGHKANILSNQYKYIGVSVKPVIQGGENNLFVVEDFMGCGSFSVRSRRYKGHKRNTHRRARIRRRTHRSR